MSSEQTRRLRYLLLASLFAALTAVGAFIRVPIPFVPLTLQTFFVVLAGSLLGSFFGALSQVFYLAIGLSGVPVFAYGGGLGYVLQPTFGYLLSYPIAAFVIGVLTWGARRYPDSGTPNLSTILWAQLAGAAIIYVIGVSVLYFNLNVIVGKETEFSQAVWLGCIVFLPGTGIKIAVATALTRRIHPILRTLM